MDRFYEFSWSRHSLCVCKEDTKSGTPIFITDKQNRHVTHRNALIVTVVYVCTPPFFLYGRQCVSPFILRPSFSFLFLVAGG